MQTPQPATWCPITEATTANHLMLPDTTTTAILGSASCSPKNKATHEKKRRQRRTTVVGSQECEGGTLIQCVEGSREEDEVWAAVSELTWPPCTTCSVCLTCPLLA